MNGLTATFIGSAAAMLFACGGSDGPVVADAVYTNGKGATVDDKATIAQALAAKDGKFLAVGTTDQIMARKGAGTKMFDLGGRTVGGVGAGS